MEITTSDRGLLSHILTRLSGPQDILSASMVCTTWNDVLSGAAKQIIFRSRARLPSLLTRFKHVKHLNLSYCVDQLQDQDLQFASESLKNLVILSLGNRDQPQECISNLGFVRFVNKCTLLENVALTSIPNLQDSGIEAMSRACKKLSALNLVNCRNLSDDALQSLKNCENIQELGLKGHFGFTSSGLIKIGENCPTLLKLSLELEPSVDITLALQSLATHCSNLQELSLKF